jgi:hypothetical protein
VNIHYGNHVAAYSLKHRVGVCKDNEQIQDLFVQNVRKFLGLLAFDTGQQTESQCRICERSSALLKQLNYDSAPPTLSLLNNKPTAATLCSRFRHVTLPSLGLFQNTKNSTLRLPDASLMTTCWPLCPMELIHAVRKASFTHLSMQDLC